MVCSNCGADNAPGTKFCTECGTPLVRACPVCGNPLKGGEKFCGECGERLEAATSPAAATGAEPPPQPEAERRLVSVLFLDLVGFTTLSESRDPEDVRDLLSRYFDTCRGLIERYGGTVEKFIGDAVMAAWGTPVTHEDDAERAVRAALDLVQAVQGLGAEVGAPELNARAGILTGEAAVTLGAIGQGMVAGDLVNTASRLQSAAEPGTVLVDEATRRAAEAAVVYADAGLHSLKGKESPVQAFRALRVVAERGGVGRSEALEPPFVGRHEELKLLKELLHATGREGRSRLVSVSGIAGIGKSRLIWELKKYVDGLAETIYWHHGRSPAYGEGVTFWALGEMVRGRARIAETDEPQEARRKLSASVAEHVQDPEERRWLEPRLAHLLGLEDAPPGEREELFAAWRRFFELLSERGTVAMVFEDLQWSDAGLLDYVESVPEWSKSSPILVITLARPELMDRRPSWGAGQRSFTAVHLEPLPDEAIAEMLRGFVQGIQMEDVERVVSRAEGVPLYAVEMVRMLAGRGILEPGEGAYRMVGEVGDLEVPNSLHALIASRLDALDPVSRHLLQGAAVLGKSFTVEALAAVTGEGSGELEPRLRDLVRKEFLSLDSDSRSPERGQYAFLQGLIREVAYGTLARTDRRQRHLAAAHHFEALGDDELSGVVATHYVEAHRATPAGPDAEALAARARDWLSQAADRAISLGSPEQALAFLDQALAVTSGGAERAGILDLAMEASRMATQYDRAVAFGEEAVAVYEAEGDVAGAALATAKMARPLIWADRPSDAIERMERALQKLGDDHQEIHAELFAALAHANAAIGAPDRGLSWVERALPIAERLGLMDLLLRAVRVKAWTLYDLGRHQEAAMLAKGRLTLAEEMGSLLDRAGALIQLGVGLLDDDPAASVEAALEGAVLARRGGDRSMEGIALGNAAETGMWAGRWAEAESALHQLQERNETHHGLRPLEAMLAALRGDPVGAIERLDEIGPEVEAAESVQTRTTYLGIRAMVELSQGDTQAAVEHAMAGVAADPSGINSPTALSVAGRAALWQGDAAKAREAVAAMAVFRGRWMRAVKATVEAGLAALEGRPEESAAGYRRAIEAWRALETPLDLALFGLDMGTMLGMDHPDAAEAVEESKAILERLGAKPFLDRLERLEQTSRKVLPTPT
ncbi:MAG: AAA family ATPase [Actinomycetota bacterium]|nr:AAA family ATPase [Actinomycetota bacterium]